MTKRSKLRRAAPSSESWAASLAGDEQSVHRIAALLAESFGDGEVAVSLADYGGGSWQVAAYFSAPPDRTVLRDIVTAAAGPQAAVALAFGKIAARDWVSESLAGLKPVTAGRFVVHGAHDRGQVGPSRIGIEIEAGLAFGTGHHGTTRGCLLALDGVGKRIRKGRRHPSSRAGGAHRRMTGTRILDLGTGSGVLAIAAARALHVPVLATDIDAASVRTAQANVRLNGAGGFVQVAHAAGVSAAAIRARAPFELVLANILLAPLQRLAAPLRQRVAPGGRLVLSGLLTAQANAALAAYRPFALERRIVLDGWATLILRRGKRRA